MDSPSRKRGIGWWSTSALESNVGLEVIANWTAQKASESEFYVGVSGLELEVFSRTTPSLR